MPATEATPLYEIWESRRAGGSSRTEMSVRHKWDSTMKRTKKGNGGGCCRRQGVLDTWRVIPENEGDRLWDEVARWDIATISPPW